MYKVKVTINLDTGYEIYRETVETEEDAKQRVGGLAEQLDLAMTKGAVTTLNNVDGLGHLAIAGSKIVSYRITAKEKVEVPEGDECENLLGDDDMLTEKFTPTMPRATGLKNLRSRKD